MGQRERPSREELKVSRLRRSWGGQGGKGIFGIEEGSRGSGAADEISSDGRADCRR